jgi:hypothetical protein
VSAVILAVIVVMWAVVLVPMWLRRHDAASETRSADKFSAAMRVLSRRNTGSPDRRYVLMPRRDSGVSVHVSGAAAVRRRMTRPAATPPPARASRRRASLAVRRRRTLLGLLSFVGLTFLLAIAGVLGWKLQLPVDLICVGFVAHLRSQARRSAVLARQRRRSAATPPPRPAPMHSPRPDTFYEPSAALAEAITAEMSPIDVAAAQAATGTEDARAWEPVPVPRPTYTMKPAAPAVTRPATAADAGHEAVVAEPIPAPEDDDQLSELDEILERRRAVND